jgi:flavin reductase (DIM6/NTAB) family NADH-FMN oxidoreductase RutF
MKRLDKNEAIELTSPHPYVLAVTQDSSGHNNIIGIGWWTFTSWEPLMLVISIGAQKRSHENLKEVPQFTLCFPSKGQAKGAWLCGTKSGRSVDKFPASGFAPRPSKEVRPPMIEGSTAAFECAVVETLETGDHTLFVAEVLAMHGDFANAAHLYSIHYRSLVSMDAKGGSDFGLKY